ncbi:MAG: cytochrome c [Desulfobacterales bacterium]|nr:cytochrome c [Desulfobacterales bacterium]
MIKRIAVLGAVVVVLALGIYAVVTVYDNLMSAGRMWETPAIKPHERPVDTMAEGVVPFSGGEAQLRATPAEELHSPWQQADEKIIERGRTVYARFCAHCHGKNYDGMGTVGQSFSPLPTDLTSPEVRAMADGELFHSISYGTPNGRQPPLHASITPGDRWRVIAFVKSLSE